MEIDGRFFLVRLVSPDVLGFGNLVEALAESLGKYYPWKDGFLFGKIEISQKLWSVIAGSSGFYDDKLVRWKMKRFDNIIDNAIEEIRNGFPFSEILDETIDTIKPIAALLQDQMPTGGRLLDLGCGALDKAMVYQKLGYQCCCADDFQDPWHRNPNNLDPVVAFAKSLGIEVYEQSEPFAVPWENESFDIVTIINVIEHLHGSPRELLNFAGTLLKPGGLLVVGMPNSVNLRKRLSVFTGRTNYTPVQGIYEFEGVWRGHIRKYTLEETCQIVRWTGFDLVSKSTFHGILRNRLRNRLLRSIFRSLCAISPQLKDSLLVAARKPIDWEPREPNFGALVGVGGHESFA